MKISGMKINGMELHEYQLLELSKYIATYIQEELNRGKTISDIDKWMISDAIEAFEGGAR